MLILLYYAYKLSTMANSIPMRLIYNNKFNICI